MQIKNEMGSIIIFSNLAVVPQITIAILLADLNWWFDTGSPHVYMQVGNLGGFNLAVVI